MARPRKGLRLEHIAAGGYAQTINKQDADVAGFVRFILDYDLSVSGAGAKVAFNFDGATSNLFGGDKVSFAQRLDGKDGPKSISSSWASGWIRYNSTEDLTADVQWQQAIRSSLSSSASTNHERYYDDQPLPPLEGDWYADVDVRLRYETMPSDGVSPAPLPKPESYALMALGFAGLGIAKRLRRRQAA